MDTNIVGIQIAKGRKSKGLSQARLAELLNVTQQCVHKWEKGETLPDVFTIGKIAEVICNFDINYFLDKQMCAGDTCVCCDPIAN